MVSNPEQKDFGKLNKIKKYFCELSRAFKFSELLFSKQNFMFCFMKFFIFDLAIKGNGFGLGHSEIEIREY